eukprot:6102016-Amphidinium_carterae.1
MMPPSGRDATTNFIPEPAYVTLLLELWGSSKGDWVVPSGIQSMTYLPQPCLQLISLNCELVVFFSQRF